LVQKSCLLDSATLDTCTRCLVESCASAGSANCSIIEESTSSAANSDGHSSGSNTIQPENILWKKFDQRVVDSAQSRTNTVGALQQYSNYSFVWW